MLNQSQSMEKFQTSFEEEASHSEGRLAPKPFVKWVGGKRQLIDILRANAPQKFGTYFEPFVGGGALTFSMLPKKAVISDMNAELINTYLVIRDASDSLIKNLSKHKNEEAYFYQMRAKNPRLMSKVDRAGRFIYLNKTCYNGLYRENSKGEFNTPFGRYTNPNIVDKENICAVSRYLAENDVTIKIADYKHVLDTAKTGDFVYFDPPYVPLSSTASFTGYHKSGFGDPEQADLADAFEELSKRGVFVMLSNSNTPLVKKLYRKFRIRDVKAVRAINCKGGKRGKESNEVLITGY